MAVQKLLHKVISSCEGCPYLEEVTPGDSRCGAPNRFVKVNPREIPADCPLPNYEYRK